MKTSLLDRDYSDRIEAFSNGHLVCSACGRRTSLEGLNFPQMTACSSCENPNLTPKKIGKFWLFQYLGGKNIGVFYKAYHEEYPHRLFTVKLLPRDDTENSDLRKALQNEADITNELGEHPCLLAGIESGDEDGEHYLAMEFVEGKSLDECLDGQKSFPEVEALLIVLRILAAEAHIHNRGYLYRNLKPENIIFSSDYGSYIYNYESCLPIESAKEASIEEDDTESLFYVSPERFLGEPEGVHSEIYSLGMVFYHMLTGRTYFSEDELKRMAIRLRGEYLTLSKTHKKMGDLSADVADIITKMIRRTPEQRYQEFHDAEFDILEALNTRL